MACSQTAPSHSLPESMLKFCGIQLRAILSQWVPKFLFCIISSKIVLLRWLPYLPGVNDLTSAISITKPQWGNTWKCRKISNLISHFAGWNLITEDMLKIINLLEMRKLLQSIISKHITDKVHEHFLWNCSQVNAKIFHWSEAGTYNKFLSEVNIDWCNGRCCQATNHYLNQCWLRSMFPC